MGGGIIKYRQIRNFKKHHLKSNFNDKGRYEDLLNEALTTFTSNSNIKNKQKLIDDIIYCSIILHTTPKEFFLFGFHKNKSKKYRNSFLCDFQKDSLLIKAGLLESFLENVKDKYRFYDILSPYFGRVCEPIDKEDFEKFKRLYTQEKALFIKERDGSFGSNAMFIKDLTAEQLSDIFHKLQESKANWIAEGVVEQHPAMAVWNESSVNTVRIPSLMYQDSDGILHHKIIQPFMRTGMKGQIIDNAGAGGIYCVFDSKTGIVTMDGYTEDDKFYEKHPSSGLKYKGSQIPDYDNLKELVYEIHSHFLEQPYVGFDFAYSRNGWVLIEGNWGQMLGQYPTKLGIRKDFEEYLSEYMATKRIVN